MFVTLMLTCISIYFMLSYIKPTEEGYKESPLDMIQNGGSAKGRSVAIVTMMRDPTDVDVFLNYHLAKGIVKFYIRVEKVANEADAVIDLLRTYPQVFLNIGSPTDTVAMKDDMTVPGQAQMLRQRTWVNASITQALRDGMDWLVHIDSDELLEPISNDMTVADCIIRDANENTQTMIIDNLEAMYDKDKPRKCFSYEKLQDCNVDVCASYANGKSVGRVSKYLQESGVHRFRYTGKRNDDGITMKSMRLIHYESCDFNKYVSKFVNLSKSEDAKFPFKYYNESIKVAKSCNNVKKEEAKCAKDLKVVYDKYRTV